jgi:hypothetical protein
MTLVLNTVPTPKATRHGARANNKKCQVFYQVCNLTGSDDDLQFPVIDHVRFEGLHIEERFEDGFVTTMPLLDPATHCTQSGLDPETCLLISQSFKALDKEHGALVAATLSGQFTSQNFHIVSGSSEQPTCVGVAQNFSATLTEPAPDSCTLIWAIDGAGERYIVGSFSLAPAAFPEPDGPFVMSSGHS